MTAWDRYVELLRKHPELVGAAEDLPGIRVITDPETVRREQQRLRNPEQDDAWTEIGVVAEDAWVYVVRDLVEFPDGRRNGYTRLVNRRSLEGAVGGVVILAVWNGRILLVRHYRHPPRRYLWEVPRGFGEPGVSPEEDVRRELHEETGATPVRLVPMGAGLPDSAVLWWQTSFYFAEINEPEPDDTEARSDGIVARRLVTPAELDEMIVAGDVVDLFTIAALGMARARGLVK